MTENAENHVEFSEHVPSEHLVPSWQSPKSNFGFADFFVIFALQLFLQILCVNLYVVIVEHKPGTLLPPLIVLIVTLFSSIAGASYYYFRGRNSLRLSWSELGWKLPSLREMGIWLAIFFPGIFLFGLIYRLILEGLFELPAPKQQIALFLAPEQPISVRVLTIMAVLISAPLVEEMIYRGILGKALLRFQRPILAAVINGLFFGLIHVEFSQFSVIDPLTNLPQSFFLSFVKAFSVVPPLSLLGFLLALSFYRTRSLLVPISLHAINNLIALFVVLFAPTG